jgi:hypothetical protein
MQAITTLLLASAFALLATSRPAGTTAPTRPDMPFSQVCGSDYKTYATPATAEAAGAKVLHCGPCGKCSNAQDVKIHVSIADTFTDKSTECGNAYASFGGEKKATKCVKDLGFSDGCTSCWMENFKCVYDNCKWDCATSLMSKSKEPSENACIACAVSKCVNDKFNPCQGAFRGSLGIESVDASKVEPVCKPAQVFKSI